MDTAMADPEAQEPDESGPEEHGGEMENTFFVPADALSGKECKAGDILKFKVVGRDSDGDIEVALDGYDNEEAPMENTDEADKAELRKIFAGPASGMKG